jgi:hypothetical protein
MNGFIPQYSSCPHCGIKRTVRLGFSSISLCMNCRTQWQPNVSSVSPATNPMLERQQPYPFSSAELARLEIYRRAVAAGFYAD